MPDLIQGLVVRTQAGYQDVHTAVGDYRCRLRGRLRKGRAEGDLVAVGDQVMIDPLPDMTGSIEQVLPRKSVFSRQLSGVNYGYQQIILANAALAMLVFACANPEPRRRMLDRFLVVTERAHIPAVIVANKTDLLTPQQARHLFAIYEQIGYSVLYTSIKTGEGLDALRERLEGRISVVTGKSGVGKSSLFNALLGRDEAIVSDQRHTTRDLLEAPLRLKQVSALLIDTAGGGFDLDATAGTSGGGLDWLRQMAWKQSLAALKSADVVLLVLDRSASLEDFGASGGLRDRVESILAQSGGAIPSSVEGLAVSGVSSTGATVSWDAVPTAVKYRSLIHI